MQVAVRGVRFALCHGAQVVVNGGIWWYLVSEFSFVLFCFVLHACFVGLVCPPPPLPLCWSAFFSLFGLFNGPAVPFLRFAGVLLFSLLLLVCCCKLVCVCVSCRRPPPR